MKKIIYIPLSLLCLLLANCSKNALDKTVYGVTTSSNFYKNADQIKQALTECYYQVRGNPYNTIITAHFFLGDISTDDAWKGGGSEADYAPGQQLQNFTVTTTNDIVGYLWSSAYAVINRCNILIDKAPQATGDKDLLARYVLEAKFLRAWMYFKLVTNYGAVPLILKDLQPQEILVPRASEDTVFAQIYKDLTDATALPKKSEYAAADMGRATSGAAWALIGKSYLFQGNFSKAEEALNNVVTSGEYQLDKEFNWNFQYDHKNGPESIWEVQLMAVPGTTYPATGNQLVQFFSSRTTEGGYGFDCPTQDLWDAYAPDDPRLTYTFILNGDRFQGDNYDQNNAFSPSGYHSRKIFVRTAERGSLPGSANKNWVVIRYADVLLMYAEALNENGKPADALKYLNMVRERARNSNPIDPNREKQAYIPHTNTATSLPDITTTDKTQLRQAIWKERRLELAMEGHRRFDLIRQKRFGEVMHAFATKYNTSKGKLFDDNRDYLLPIPSNEVLLSQGKLKQNPGY